MVATQPDAGIQAAIDRIQGDSSFQTSLPEAPQSPPDVETPEWIADLVEWLAGPGQWLVNGLFILIIIAAMLFVLYLTVPAVRDGIDSIRRRLRRSKAEHESDEQPGWRPDEHAARSLLDQADALAAAGQYAQAVHLLLNHSVSDIDRRRPDVVRPALTARAIARLDSLPEMARAPFGAIAAIVERGLWARLPVNNQDWTEARAHYQQFAFGDHWRAGRA